MLTIGKEDLSSQTNLADFNIPKGLNTQRKELKSSWETGRGPNDSTIQRTINPLYRKCTPSTPIKPDPTPGLSKRKLQQIETWSKTKKSRPILQQQQG